MMELKEFVKTAISDITGAVSELQSELHNGTVVNPTLARGEDNKSLLIENEVRMIERLNFDVAVTASESSDTEGGAKAGISIFGAKVGIESTASTEHASRITFSIPIVMPSTHVKTSSEIMYDKRPKKPKC